MDDYEKFWAEGEPAAPVKTAPLVGDITAAQAKEFADAFHAGDPVMACNVGLEGAAK